MPIPGDKTEAAVGTAVRIPSISIGYSALTVGLLILVTLVFHFGDQTTKDTLNFFVLAGAFAVGGLGVYYVYATLKAGLEQRREALQEQRRNMALLFIRRWNDPNLGQLRRDWRNLVDSLLSDPSGVPALLSGDIAKRTVVADVLNFFEEMGYAARDGSADLETLRALFRGVCLRYYTATRPWIDYRRKESKNAWSQFEWLCDQWKAD